jgi:hypothetical protein
MAKPNFDGLRQTIRRATDARPLVRTSRLRIGPLRARGVPAILCGVAAIVLASRLGDAVRRGAAAFPESLHEARLFWIAVRGEERNALP